MTDHMGRNRPRRTRSGRRLRTSLRDGATIVALDDPAREDAQASRAGFIALPASVLQASPPHRYDLTGFH
jgi:hypothetical protein